MVGLIISGHGNFASGLRTSLKLIAGEASNIEYVDFIETDSTESLMDKYLNSLKNLDNCDSILALSDLAGGSPFKTLVEQLTNIVDAILISNILIFLFIIYYLPFL